MGDSKLYPPQDPMELGGWYTRHVVAMTTEKLHDKADIAEQLAWRDKRIEELEAQIAKAQEAPAQAGGEAIPDPAIGLAEHWHDCDKMAPAPVTAALAQAVLRLSKRPAERGEAKWQMAEAGFDYVDGLCTPTITLAFKTGDFDARDRCLAALAAQKERP